MKNIRLTIAVLFLSLAALGQKGKEVNHDGNHHGIDDHDQWKKVKIADNLFEQHSYYNAVDEYLKVLQEIPENEYVHYKIALTYHKARDYKNAEKYFRQSTKLEDSKSPNYPMAWFFYGESLQMNAKYMEAKEAYLRFGRLKVKSPEVKLYKKYASNAARMCSYAIIEVEEDSAYYNVDVLGDNVNHAYTDFSPHPLGPDTLIFASLRHDTVLTYAYGEEKIFPVRLFQTTRSGNDWGEPEEFPDVNSEIDHSANGVYTPGKDKFFFTRCAQDPHNNIVCHIYYKVKTEEGWSKPHKAHHKVNVGGFTSTQPTFGQVVKKKKKTKTVKDVLYFVSNRPGGAGGLDIWYSEMDAGGDLSAPVNCGKRVNTIRDEVAPNYDQAKSTLYFSSNYHHGFGGYDVFSSTGSKKRFKKPVNLEIPINSSYDDTYYVPVEDASDPLNEGYLVSNRPGGHALTSETCCDDIYSFQEYIPPTISLSGLVRENLILDDSLDAKIDSTLFTASVDTTGVPELDSSKLGRKPALEITNMDGVEVGIVSQRHVKKAKEVGATGLTFFKDRIDWVDTTRDGGKYLTDLVVGKHYSLILQKEGMQAKIVSLDSVMKTAVDGKATLDVDVFKKKEKEVKEDPVKKRQSLTLDIDAKELQGDVNYVLDNMYFEFDKDVIKRESIPSCELLLNFMEKHPKIRVEVQGHTDSRGDDDYNKDLSQRRAESVRKYCIDHGIESKRLRAKGFGEDQPIAKNENTDGSDNPEGRALNRRTEIKIFGSKKGK